MKSMKTALCSVLACAMIFGATLASAETYTASAKGFGGDVTVNVTVENEQITAVEATGISETPSLGGEAMTTMAAAMVENQTPYVDGVSGATLTSNAMVEAAAAALTQAGMTFEKEEAVRGEDETTECDVLVIGMGASGTTAALSAAENGAKVIGVDSSAMLGGMGNAAQGMFAIGTSLQAERYGDDLGSDEEYWFNKYMEQSNMLGNAALIRTFVSEAKNTVEYLLDHDIAVYLSKTAQQVAHFDETIIYHRWNNTQPFVHFQEYLDKNNVEIRWNTTATELLTDENGAVIGAVCTKEDGSQLTVNAKAVIVATGSFAGNESMMREALGTAYDNVSVMGGCDGSGLEMMYAVGAAKGELLTMNHGVGPKSRDMEVATNLTMNTPCLWVNNQGKRFMNEDLLKDTVEYSSAVLAQGGYAYTIVDQKTVDRWADASYENTGSWIHYWDQNGIIGEDGERTIYHAPIDKDAFLRDFETLTVTGDGIVANTLEEAAAFIGCKAEDLIATVEKYNGYVNAGKDEEFYKSAESLLWTVEEGPFYVTKGYNAVLGALGGVNTNELLQVVDETNTPISGLYATGNNVSGVSVAAYVNIEGTGLGFALTSGRLAGANAAAAIK